MKINSIMFVCTGNTCRSPMAEQIFVDILNSNGEQGVKVASSGLSCINGMDMTEEAKQALVNMGLKPYPHYSTRFDMRMLAEYDLIVTMTTTHKFMIGILDKVFSMQDIVGYDISDPYGGTQEDYDDCAYSIKKGLLVLFDEYKKQSSN
ncbi:MAG: hypothetical protein J6Q52_06200 [Clostridia bacterium]|nr:hypothetical protein [Clostridia bacterium]